ncbi:prepilin-type N-terminal cleavage/methylation domain-containing protein (plasmid) [Leisingera sp. M527]|uniref:type II secretion system protein GspJ n=1 Tax=Leisingera sp. M527 TaxID=2867014 RepID=UPI0021A912E4|nr:type II secretion system protein GspJ [Leisingera sp. M527]UWQ35180.1 prepilin-type N-terminal cleavage/methylation domain-containing protein [Leisingera sp. M527]
MKPGRAPADRGLSLIELVAAMAVFALVAVLGAQALGGMIRMRGTLEARAAETAALEQALSLLRADLSAAVPMLFYPPGRGAPQSALSLHGGVLALSAGGQPALVPDPQALGLQRIEWQLQGGRLSRRAWPALIPASAASRSPAVTVLEGVSGLRVRSYWEGPGWVEGTATLSPQPQAGTGAAADADRAGSAPEVYSSTLPLAVELQLETKGFGSIRLLETLK